MELPDLIENDIGALCRELEARGCEIVVASTGPMHSYQVVVSGPVSLVINADRGQLILSGDRGDLEPHELWRAYDDRDDFRRAVMRLVESRRS